MSLLECVQQRNWNAAFNSLSDGLPEDMAESICYMVFANPYPATPEWIQVVKRLVDHYHGCLLFGKRDTAITVLLGNSHLDLALYVWNHEDYFPEFIDVMAMMGAGQHQLVFEAIEGGVVRINHQQGLKLLNYSDESFALFSRSNRMMKAIDVLSACELFSCKGELELFKQQTLWLKNHELLYILKHCSMLDDLRFMDYLLDDADFVTTDHLTVFANWCAQQVSE